MMSEPLSSIDGVAIYPIVSLVLFFSIFVFMVFKVMKLDKKYINQMENIPLDSNLENDNNPEFENEIQK